MTTHHNNASLTVSRIFNARNIVLKQLGSRGYNIDGYLGCGVNEVNAMYLYKQLDMSLSNPKNKEKTYVRFHTEKTFNLSSINDIIEDLYVLDNVLTSNDTLIIITKQEIKTMNPHLNRLYLEGYFIILLSLDRLQFNILEHDSVPPHVILNNEEIEIMKKTFNITELSQLPDISRYDPVSLAIGIRPGQICKIDRPSKSAIQSIYYRLCTQ